MRRLERGRPGPGRTTSGRSAGTGGWAWLLLWGSSNVFAAVGVADCWVSASTTSAVGAFRIDDLRATVAIIFFHPIGVRVRQRSLLVRLRRGLTI